jgi:hypothetical protein
MPKISNHIALSILFVLALLTSVSGQELTFSVTPTRCFAEKSGMVKLLISNGISPYIFILSKDSLHKSELKRSPLTKNGSFVFSDIPAGKYYVTAICSDGKAFCKSLTIDQPAQLLPGQIKVEAYPSSASSNDGALLVNPTGGIPPYTFSWQGIGVKGIENKISGLSTGIFKCSIKDSNGCGPVSVTILLKSKSESKSTSYYNFNQGHTCILPSLNVVKKIS